MTRPARSDLVSHGDPAPALDENHTALSADLQNLMPRDKAAGRGAEGGRPRTPHIPQNAR